jgi:hypothetical protein
MGDAYLMITPNCKQTQVWRWSSVSSNLEIVVFRLNVIVYFELERTATTFHHTTKEQQAYGVIQVVVLLLQTTIGRTSPCRAHELPLRTRPQQGRVQPQF